jgi:hypothetical protein
MIAERGRMTYVRELGAKRRLLAAASSAITPQSISKEMTQADFDAVLDVHLRGAFHVVRPPSL